MKKHSRIHPAITKTHPYSFKDIPLGIIKKELNLLIQFFENDLKKNEHFLYFCAPLRASENKTGKEHILESLKGASQIVGGEFNGKKPVLWLPHLHGFSIFNEFTNPNLRDYGIKFTSLFIKKFKPLMVFMDGPISSGMKHEVEMAKYLNLTTIKLSEVKHYFKNLPKEDEVNKIYDLLLGYYPSDFFDHPSLNQKGK